MADCFAGIRAGFRGNAAGVHNNQIGFAGIADNFFPPGEEIQCHPLNLTLIEAAADHIQENFHLLFRDGKIFKED